MTVAFHTVFVLNENIKWMEEFLIYYINLGIDKFYLYHNEGTSGDGLLSKEVNRYGFSIRSESTEEDFKQLNLLLEKYKKYISYTLWQPRNEKNEIVYGQKEAIVDCLSKYGHLHEWMCFLDLDEFIFSKRNVNFVDFLNSLDPSISAVKLVQKKFLDRFLSKEQHISQEFNCIEGFKIGTEWAPKNIIRCRDFAGLYNVHNIYVKNKTATVHEDLFRFNHYNINDKQLAWMQTFYDRREPFSINAVDDGMKRYQYLFADFSND